MMINKEMYSCYIPKRRVIADSTKNSTQAVDLKQELINVFRIFEKACYFRVTMAHIY
jgi:hypothetical protein